MSDLRILVVEDDPGWQEELPQILQRIGSIVNVDVAPNYEEALTNIITEIYDLIIIDLALSGNPPTPQSADKLGMDLLKIIRDSEYNKDCGLIVLTAYGSITLTNEARRDYSVHDFIEKDKFDPPRFVESARAAIRNARMAKAEAKTKRRWRLTVTFDQDHLLSSELTGPDRHAVYTVTDPQRFNVADLIRRTDTLDHLILTGGPDIWRHEVQSVGKEIYKILSGEHEIQNGLIAAQTLPQHSNDLWLEFRGPTKGLSIPFELLHNGKDYLSRTYILTRRLVQTGPTILRKTLPFHTFLSGLVKRKETLRILIVGANTNDNIPAAEREATSLKATMESDLLQLGIPCEVKLLIGANATYDKVQRALHGRHYHIFHYAGHGYYDDILPEKSGLILDEENVGQNLTAAKLNTLVRETELYLVFLNCCLSARNASQAGRGDFHSTLEAIANADVPIVLGYRWTVADEPAMRLAEAFYETLWRTFSPGEALLEARIRATLGSRGRDDETWASPVLVVQNV